MRSAIQQLQKLSYMRIVRERSTSGQFIHSRWIVSDEPIVDWDPYIENPAVEKPVLDQPVQGNQGTTNIEFVEIHRNSKIATTSSPTSISAALPMEIGHEAEEEIWLWLCEKLSIDAKKAQEDCAGLSRSEAMDVLTEVLECKRQGGIRKSVPQFMSSLLRKARAGKFNLSAGTALRRDLPQILQRKKAIQVAATVLPPTAMNAAQGREKLRQLRDELARKSRASGMMR